MTDLKTQYRQLIIQQYFDKPNATAEIDVTSNEIQLLFDFIDSWQDEFDIDKGTGDRLDLIGKIVGVSRIVPGGGDPLPYFGFDGTPNARTFGEAPFFDIINDSGFSDAELDDTRYRFFIKAKITKNIAAMLMDTESRTNLQDVIQYLFDNKAFVLDNLDMSLDLYIDESFSEDDIRLIVQQGLLPSPQGVGYKNIYFYSDDGTFGFAENPNAKTFGEGKFASLLVM